MTPRHTSRPPSNSFRPPTTPQPRISTLLAPQAPKRTYEQSYMRFFFCNFFFGFETRVRAIVHAFLMFLFIYYLFLPSKRVYEQSYMGFLCFYSFIMYFTLEMCVYEQVQNPYIHIY